MRFQILRCLLLLGLLTACGQATAGFGEAANKPHEHSTASGHAHATTTTADTLQPVLATSELVVGPNRVAFGLLENNVPIPDAAQTTVDARFFKLVDNQATEAGEERARYYDEGLGPRGAFIIHPTFDTPGAWGLELNIQRPDKPATIHRLGIEVTAKSNAVAISAPAPRSVTPTAADSPDLTRITSASTPDPRLYQLSVKEAVSSGKPSLILFATPGFCQTQVCGPSEEVVSRLVDTFGDKLNAVHVEIYRYPFEELKPVPAMQEWGLKTEPWLFLVGKDGNIVGRYEGGITIEELEPEVAKLVQS